MEKNAIIFRPHIRFGNPQPTGLPVPLLEAPCDSYRYKECLDACGLVSRSGGVWTTHLPRPRLYGVPRFCKGFQTFANATQMVVKLVKKRGGSDLCQGKKRPMSTQHDVGVNRWLTGVPRFPPPLQPKLAKQGKRGGAFFNMLVVVKRGGYVVTCEKKNVATPTCCNRVNPEIYYPHPHPGRNRHHQG